MFTVRISFIADSGHTAYTPAGVILATGAGITVMFCAKLRGLIHPLGNSTYAVIVKSVSAPLLFRYVWLIVDVALVVTGEEPSPKFHVTVPDVKPAILTENDSPPQIVVGATILAAGVVITSTS